MNSLNYRVSTDKQDIDIEKLFDFLSIQSYWASGRTLETIRTSIDNSICFSVVDDKGEFIGFGRVITDLVTFGYLADVFVDPSLRGQGIGTLLLETIMGYRDFKQLNNWFLYTRDAHSFYRKFGWQTLDNPERAMIHGIKSL